MSQNPIPTDIAHGVIPLDDKPEDSAFEDFIYLVSHDVRNSVRALIELPQWIEQDITNAGVKIEGPLAEKISLMNTHTGRLDRMLVDMLAFSRVGRMQNYGQIDLNTVLQEVLEGMRVPAGFTVRSKFSADTLGMGDRDTFTLLMQLISNAIKHHDKDQGDVLLTSDEENEVIALRVSDNGPGIEREFHDEVFAAMTTLQPRDEVEGSGMGLAIVHKIARHYGGQVSIGNGLDGRGTMIEVQVPKTPAAQH